MKWLVQPDSPISEEQLPQVEIRECVGVVGPINDFRGQLLDAESQGIGHWAMKRQLEYSTGRHFAHMAMHALGETPASILRREDRSPVWPRHLLGSIAHSDDVAIAVVAHSRSCSGIGVDIECRGRIGAELFDTLFTVHEQRAIRDGRSATELFCAKEALYKAVHPMVRKFIDFTDVTFVDGAADSDEVHYIGEDQGAARAVSMATFSKRLTINHACVIAWLPLADHRGYLKLPATNQSE
jgi:4'-phosphopantetheinyl transferase EntD